MEFSSAAAPRPARSRDAVLHDPQRLRVRTETVRRLRRERFEVLLRARRHRSSIPGYTTPRSSSTGPGYRSSRGAKQHSKTAARRTGTRAGRRGRQQLISRLQGTASRIAISRPSASRDVVVLGSYTMRNRCPPGWRPPVQMRLDEGRFRRHVFVKAVGPASSAARRSRRKDPASRRGVTTQMQARFGPGASQDLPRRPPGLEMNWAVAREPTVCPSSWAASPRYTTRGDGAVTRTGQRRAIIYRNGHHRCRGQGQRCRRRL